MFVYGTRGSAFCAEMTVDSESRAERMKANFRDRPEPYSGGFLRFFAGNVNYLFD